MVTKDDLNTSDPVDPLSDRVHDSNYVLNELKSQELRNSGIFGAVEIEELGILWEHEFNVLDENSGNGITDKFFEYSANVVRNGPDVDVPEGEFIRTKERGDYGAGKQAVPGFAGRWTQDPIADQDGWMGYYDTEKNIGSGIGYKHFDEGENGATSAGPQAYVFYEVGGEGREVVPQEHWNISSLDGSDNYPEFNPTDGCLVRLPHAAYGHARLEVRIGVKVDDEGDFSYAGDAFRMYPAHVFVKPGETMLDKFDLPIEWNVSGAQNNGFALKATAAHYQGDIGREIKRTSGEGFTPNKNGGNVITLNPYPDWTYLISFRQRTGWEAIDITPIGLSINATNNIEAQLTVGGEFNNTSYALPEDTGESEGAVEYDLKTYDLANDTEKTTDTSIVSNGRREWYDTIPGDKQTPTALSANLSSIVLSSQEPIAFLVRPATGTSTDVRYAALRNGSNF